MQQDWLNLPVIGQQLGVISVMLKADRKTAQTIGLHCVPVRSTAVGCAVEFRLWRLGTLYADSTT